MPTEFRWHPHPEVPTSTDPGEAPAYVVSTEAAIIVRAIYDRTLRSWWTLDGIRVIDVLWWAAVPEPPPQQPAARRRKRS